MKLSTDLKTKKKKKIMQEFRPGGYNVLPPVVKNILIINVIFFLASYLLPGVLGIDLTDLFGLHYFGAEKFYPFQFITYMFMHGGIGHIFFNMFALWMFGSTLENNWGPKKFIIYYFFTGIGAALVHYTIFYFEISPIVAQLNAYLDHPTVESFNRITNSNDFLWTEEVRNYYNTVFVPKIRGAEALASNSQAIQASIDFISFYKGEMLNAPTVVGASGSIFGLLLGFGMMFPNSLIYLYFAIPVKAKWFVIGYAAIELYSGMSNNPGDNVAHFAHLGGALFGLILILFWKKNGKLYTYN